MTGLLKAFYLLFPSLMCRTNKVTTIFTGKPAIKVYRGQTIKSSLFNRQKVEFMDATFDALVGNEFASPEMHGGFERVAYCYTEAHYQFWRKQRTDLSFVPGVFGENLLLQNPMPEDQVYIGDRFEVGNAIFSVSGPRLPCRKLGVQMNDLSFVEEFSQAGRTGFYLRLEQAGTVKTGDKMKLLTKGNQNLSVSVITQLILGVPLEVLNCVKTSAHLARDLKMLILKIHFA